MTNRQDIEHLAARDAEARERIHGDFDTSFLVEAAAGTGKTTALIGRLVALLANGRAEVDRVVAVTFTRKAAGELKLRLRVGLERARADAADGDPSLPYIERALARLEEAMIGTIHSFCAEILHQRPVAAGIDPGFRELDPVQSEAIHEQAFRRWIQESLEAPTPTLRRTLARLAHPPHWMSQAPLERLRAAALRLLDWRDFTAPWQQQPVDLEADVDRLTARVLEVAALSADGVPGDALYRALAPARDLADWILKTESEAERDYPTLEARLVAAARELGSNRNWKGRGTSYSRDVLRRDVAAERDALLAELDDFRRQADADLAVQLQRELAPVALLFDDLKQRQGGLDFTDLLLRARDLLVADPSVRHYFQQRYTHLFVDEFQDTDPIQAEILVLLAADDPAQSDWRLARPVAGKLFLVGDPKQSIYRFRRADVRFYQQVQQHLLEAGVEQLYLARSFRAVTSLQQMTNAAFEPVMQLDAEAGQADYVPLLPVREDAPDLPAVIALPVPRPYGWRSLTGTAIKESLPDATGAFVRWLVEESGWTVEDPESGERVPIRPDHVCLLFRNFVAWKSDITNGYVRALELRGLPHVLVGGRSLHHREEIETLRTALTAIEWPDDELSMYATLRGSLFALLDEQLFRYREAGGRLDPLARRLEDEEHGPVVAALDILADLHRERNREPVSATLERLLHETRAHAGFLLRPAGLQVLANVDYLIGIARAWERRGGTSFRGFVDHLSAESESTTARQPSVIEETEQGVRLMTLHSAKGLEFPIVILADPATNATREPALTVDPEIGLCAQRVLDMTPWDLLERGELERSRDQAEAVRVAYVAATRARDLLVVPAVGDLDQRGKFFPATGWLAPLYPALYPERDRFHLPVAASGTPRFGISTVLARPSEKDGRADESVHPGLHSPQAGQHQVLWWDPAVLGLDVESNFGVVQKNLLAEPDDGDGGREAYRRWSDNRRRLTDSGSTPGRRITTVTDIENLPALPAGALVTPDVEITRPSGERPTGRRFGTLVHAVLRDAPLNAGKPELEHLVEYHRRVHQATAIEATAAVEAVEAALACSSIRSAQTADLVEREYPFLLRTDDGTILDGVVDLFHISNGTMTLIDFKTDLTSSVVPESYLVQVSWYSLALQRLTGTDVRIVLLGV